MDEKKKSLLSAAVLFVIFAVLGAAVKLNGLRPLDRAVGRLALLYRPDSLVRAVGVGTNIGYFKLGIPVLAVVVLLLAAFKQYRLAWLSAAAPLAAVWAAAFKALFARPRPTAVFLGFNPVPAHGFSYPSGHAVFSAAVYGLLLIIILTKIKGVVKYIPALILSLILLFVLVSRLYLGAHFLTDVIGGAALGLSWALVLWSSRQQPETADGGK